MPLSEEVREIGRTDPDRALAMAIARRTPGEQEALEQAIAKEIAEHGKCQTFLPSSYARLRRLGYEPSEIDYDMSHIWR